MRRRRTRRLPRERERGAPDDLALASLGLGPDLAVDEPRAVLVAHGGDGALAGDDVAWPGELGEAGAELAHVADAGGVHQELAEVAHGEHAVREHAGVAGVLRELVVDV